MTILLAVYAGFVTVRTFKQAPAATADKPAAGPKNREEALSRVRLKARVTVDRETELLDRLARANSQSQKIEIIEQLGHIGGAATIVELKKLSTDRRYGVASNAIMALGRIGGPDVVDHLLTLVDKAPRYPSTECSALALTGDSQAMDRLMELALEPGNVFRNHAILALADIGGPEVRELYMSLIDDYATRDNVINAIGAMEGEESTKILLELVDSGDITLKRLALGALASTKSPEAVPVLLKAALGNDVAAAEQALSSLGNIGDESAIKAIARLAETGPQRLQHSAVYALGNIGGPVAVKTMMKMLQTGEGNLPLVAANALISEGSPEALAAVTLAAETATGRRQIEFMSNLSGNRSPEVDAYFLKMSKSNVPELRNSALQHLVSIGNPEGEALALHALKNGSRDEQSSAMSLLGMIGSDTAREALWEAAKGGGPFSSQALSVLGDRFMDEDVASHMLERFKNANQSDAQTAMYALVNSGDPRAREMFLETAKSDDPTRAVMAVNALSDMGMDDATRSLLVDLARQKASPGEEGSYVRTRALDVLVSNGGREGLRVARDIIHGDDPEMAVSALQTLSSTREPGANDIARSAVGAKDASVRASAAAVLAQSGAQNVDLLEKLSHDSEASVATQAIQGLSNIGDDKSVDILVALSKDPARRADALSSLAQTTHPRAEETLIELVETAPSADVATAIRASYQMTSERFENTLREALQSKNKDVARAAAESLNSRGLPLTKEERARIKTLTGSTAALDLGIDG